LLLKNLLGIPSPQKSPVPSTINSSKSSKVNSNENSNNSSPITTSSKVSKTNLLKQQLNVAMTPSKLLSSTQTPPVSAKQSKKLNKQSPPIQIPINNSMKSNSNKDNNKKVLIQTPKTGPRFAGSAFETSPHPDHIPLPDFDENFFDN